MITPEPKGVFINVPFDHRYEALFITLVGTLVFLRQEPHCVLEVRERGDGRLARIFALMQSCRMSIHDVSRAGLPARFNIPFELGLACVLTDRYDRSYPPDSAWRTGTDSDRPRVGPSPPARGNRLVMPA